MRTHSCERPPFIVSAACGRLWEPILVSDHHLLFPRRVGAYENPFLWATTIYCFRGVWALMRTHSCERPPFIVSAACSHKRPHAAKTINAGRSQERVVAYENPFLWATQHLLLPRRVVAYENPFLWATSIYCFRGVWSLMRTHSCERPAFIVTAACGRFWEPILGFLSRGGVASL